MKLSSKLYLGFGSVLVLLVAMSVLAILKLGHIAENIQHMKEHASLMMGIKEKEVGHLDWISKVQTALIDASSRKIDVETDPHQCKFGQWYYGLGKAEAEEEVPAIQNSLKEIEAYHTSLHQSALHINEALAGNDREAAQKIFINETLPSLKKVREHLASINDAVGAAGLEAENEAIRDTSSTGTLLMALSIAALILGAFISFSIVSRVMKQLGGDPCEVVRAAHKIADGDLTVEINFDRSVRNSALACLSKMADALDAIVTGISTSAHQLAASIDQISSGNQNLSQRSSEQASAIEEIAATLEETSSMIKQNADNAAKAQEVSAETSRMAEEGGNVIIEAVNSINEVNQSSKKISEISGVINDIAFQTNLLALNAAVEAARAGEQGKGFAVVAEEVRNLAQRSGEAAREIAVLIQDSVKKVETATALANKGKDSLQEIISAVKETGRLIDGVASASEEQLRGIDQISTAVSEIDSLTQQDAALVEETASASEEVAGQARNMLVQIKGFKTKKG